MKRTKRIDGILQENLVGFIIDIVDSSYLHSGHNNFNGDGETHITVNLKSIDKIKINRLELHKQINSLLKNEFNNGLHSLEIKINLLD